MNESRLVTLIGTGGVGKTRLALRIAGMHQRAFPDGVWLVELDKLHDPALIAQTVARTLGIVGKSGTGPIETLIEYVAGRRLLLILDNCEHLVDAVAKLTNSLLRASPYLYVLATSREALGIDGEFAIAVPPLSAPDPAQTIELPLPDTCEAVALFVARAAMVVPGFTISPENRVAIAEICHRLDGLPLAIELAVSWLRTLSPQQLRDRLKDRLNLLRRGPRAGPVRHQTLWNSIGWSYDLCTQPERRLWARLSVFAGAFDLDAATDVCADSDSGPMEVVELTASLLDKSILIREEDHGVERYRLLDSVRAYGAERLREMGQEATLRRRHRDRYAQSIRWADADWLGSLKPDWFNRIDREHPDIRAALEFSLTEPDEARAALAMAGALHPYWVLRGLTSEGRYWLDRALARDTGASAEAVVAAWTSAILAALQGDLTAANAAVARTDAIATELGDRWSRAIALLAEGAVAVHSGDLERARACHVVALASFQALGDRNWSTLSLTGQATVRAFLGEHAEAAALYEQVLTVSEHRDEAWLRPHTLWILGIALWKQGEPDRAAERIERGLRLTRQTGDAMRSAWCLEALAWIAASRDQPRRAAVLLGASQALAHSVGAPAATSTYSDLRAYHEECVRRARGDLGDAGFVAAVAYGAASTLDDAIAYALNDLPEKASSSPATAARRAGTAEPTALTRREQEICQLVAEGLSNNQIATQLVISRRTVESHVQNIMVKLGFTSRTQIAAWVAGQGPDAA